MSKSILNHPIFQLGVDARTKDFDVKWFDEVALPQFQSDKSGGYLPVAHIGHNDGVTERPRVAFMDNLRRVGNTVFCDMTDIPDVVAPAIAENLFPNRSVEIRADRKGFASCALLGSSEPHFKLGQDNPLVENHFKALVADGETEHIQFEAADISLTDALEVQQLEEHSWKIDSALWSKLWDIKNSESMTADEKKAAIEAAMQEWLGLAAQVQKDIVDITDGGTAPAQFKAVDLQRDAHFRAREAALIERENKIIRDELLQAGLAIPVVDNFLALRKHIPDEDKTIQFKAGDKVESITPRAGFEHFLRDVANRFQAGTLAVETKPIPVSTVTDDPVADRQQSDAVRETKAIEQFMADQKITNFAEARRAFLASEAGQKFRAAIA